MPEIEKGSANSEVTMAAGEELCAKCSAVLGRDFGGGVCAACLLEDVLPNANGGKFEEQRFGGEGAESFGEYELLEEIGRGGMGVIFKARHQGLDRTVALKMLLAGEFAGEKEQRRLLREAKMAARLNHRGIVTVHDAGMHKARPFFTMEFVAGPNLAEVCRAGLLPLKTAARYTEQLADAVQYAHEQGILHRDLKPANVLISPEDEPKLTDFGLTKGVSDLTRTAEHAGSPGFMAPEQANSRLGPTSVSTDVYGLGAILYYLLTGHPPALGETLAETVRSVAEDDPVPPRQLRPALPRDLETIALRCLAKNPAQRYRSAGEIALELRRWSRGEPIRARPAGPIERLSKWGRRKPAIAAFSAAFVTALLVGVSGIVWQWRRAEAERTVAQAESYAASLQLAQQHLAEGNLERARDLLFAQPEALRNVEWGRLVSQCFPELARVSPAALHPSRNPLVESFDGRVARGGKYFVTQGGGITQLWRTSDGRELHRWEDSNDNGGPAEFSEDGNVLFLRGRGGERSSWEVPGGERISGEANRNALAVSDKYSVIITTNRRVEVRGAESKAVFETPEGSLPYASAGITRSGRRLIALHADSAGYDLWDVPGRRLVRSNGERVSSWLFSPDEKYILTGGSERFIRVWDAETGEFLEQINTGQAGAGRKMSISPDGGFLISFGFEQSAVVCALQPRDSSLRYEVWPVTSAFSPDDSKIAAPYLAGKLLIWDLASKKPLHLQGHRQWVTTAEFSRDGKYLYSGSADRTVRMWDTASGALLRTATNHERAIIQLQASPDGSRVFSSDFGGQLWISDAQTLAPERRIQIQDPRKQGFFFDIHPDGGKVLAASPPGIVEWDARTGARLWERSTDAAEEYSMVRYAPDGRRFVVEIDGRLQLWRREPVSLLAEARGRGSFSHSIFTADGERLLTVSVDASGSSIGSTSIEVRDGHTLKLLVSLGRIWGTGIDVRLAGNERLLSRTRIDDSALGTPIDLWTIFPWRDRDYASMPGATLEERAAHYARQGRSNLSRTNFDLARIEPAKEWMPERSEWPQRDRRTPARCIDLTPSYNAWLDSAPVFINNDLYVENHLGSMPHGLATLDGIPFDIRGIVAGAADFWPRFQPRDSYEMPVRQRCRKLHFLQCASVAREGPPKIGRYRLHYANGEVRELELRLGRDILDWWGQSGEAAPPESLARIVWRGHNPAADRFRKEVRVAVRTWENPLPEVAIDSVDFISEKAGANPLLIALTLE